ncbi:MAG: hypothetical protein LBU60_04175 [Clostridiales bacterium]|jgi:hypothetical protein|nr:hypothetical protein [Clostridiales bacterium]
MIEQCPRNIRELLAKLLGKPDGTYELLTHEKMNWSNGYSFCFEQTSDCYTDSEYIDIVNKLIKYVNSKVYGGVYCGNYPEATFHTKKLELAMEIANKFNQESIWDCEISDLIYNKNYDFTTNKINKGDLYEKN